MRNRILSLMCIFILCSSVLAVMDFSQVVVPGNFSETYLLDEEGVYHVSVKAGGGWEFDGPAEITRGAGSWSKEGSYGAKLNEAYSFSSAAVETVELHGYLKKGGRGGKGNRPEYTAEFNFENCYIKSTSPVESEISVSIPYGSDAVFVSVKNTPSASGHAGSEVSAVWTVTAIENGGNIPQELIDGMTSQSITIGSGNSSTGPLYPGIYDVTARWGTSITDSMVLVVGPSLNIIGHRRISGDSVKEADEDDPLNLIVPVNDDNDDEGKVPYHDNSDSVKNSKDDDFFVITLVSPKLSTGTVLFEAPKCSRVFIGDKPLGNYSVDLSDPKGDLAPLASGTDVDLFVESLEKTADAVFTYSYSGEFSAYDSLHVMMTSADADVDSNNDNNLNNPACDQFEDDREYAKLASDILDWPGKIFNVNNEDLDLDGIPDFADGFDRFDDFDDDNYIPNDGEIRLPFIPVIIRLPEGIDQEKVRFSFEYAISRPDDVERKQIGQNPDGTPVYSFSAPAGFRIWKRDLNWRNKKSILDGGDLIPSSDGSNIIKISPAQLGMNGSALTLYAEATPGAELLSDSARILKLKVYTTNYPEKEYVLDDDLRLNPILMEFLLKGEDMEKMPSNFVGVGFPRPQVLLDAVSPGDVKILGNNEAVVEIKGKVYDPVADNMPESVQRIKEYQVFVDGEKVKTGKIVRKSLYNYFWKNRAYLGEIGPVQVKIPLSYEGAHSIRIFTSENPSGMVGYDEVSVSLSRQGNGLQKEKWTVMGVENRIGSSEGAPLQTSFRLRGLANTGKYLCKLGDSLKYELVELEGYFYPKHEFPLIMSFYQPYFEDGYTNNETLVKCHVFDPGKKENVPVVFMKNVPVTLVAKESQDKPVSVKKGSFSFVDLAVDGNKDGTIDFMDSQDREYVFWVNDDNDTIAYKEGMWQEDDINDNAIDCDDDKIDCLRDLEDFERIQFIVPARMEKQLYAGPNGPKLSIVSDKGVQVNLFHAVDDSKKYVSSKDIASVQKSEISLVNVSSEYKSINRKEVVYGDPTPFLFEGKQEGEGTVYLQVRMNNMVVCSSPLVMKLGNIKSFYRCFRTGINGQMLDDNVAGTYVERNTPVFGYNAKDNNKLAMFVHGWNIPAWETERWTETMFKRLWHQGYDGQVAAYIWPCLTHNRIIPPLDNFDRSEYRAWQSGTVLKDVLVNLRENRGMKISVLAHSQGNVVVGEALKSYNKPKLVDNYVASQAALSAHFYDENVNQLAYFLLNTGPETPEVIRYYYSGNSDGNNEPYLKSVIDVKVASRFVRYFNEDDFAFSRIGWQLDNLLKPNTCVIPSSEKSLYYDYSGSVKEYKKGRDKFIWDNFLQLYDYREIKFPKGRHEIFAFSSESRVRPLGTVTSAIAGFDSEYDLKTSIGYNQEHYSHSKEFRSNIVDELGYWKRFLDDIN